MAILLLKQLGGEAMQWNKKYISWAKQIVHSVSAKIFLATFIIAITIVSLLFFALSFNFYTN